MIRYLEQLERDLADAIDRRQAEPARRRRRLPRRRPGWAPVAAAIIALLAIAVAIVGLRPRTDHERAVGPRPGATVRPQKHAPIPPGTPLRLVGNVTRVDSSTWRGQARGPGGVGTLTITGTIDVSARSCCETPRDNPPPSIRSIVFTWATAGGNISGCVANRIYRRPHGRYVWDGVGHITSATGTLRRYRNRGIGIAGDTRTTAPDEARIILGSGTAAGSC